MRRLLSELRARLDAIESRLPAVEQRVGTGADTRELDQQLERVRGERVAAATLKNTNRPPRCVTGKGSCSPRRQPASRSGKPQHPGLPLLADGALSWARNWTACVPYCASTASNRKTDRVTNQLPQPEYDRIRIRSHRPHKTQICARPQLTCAARQRVHNDPPGRGR